MIFSWQPIAGGFFVMFRSAGSMDLYSTLSYSVVATLSYVVLLHYSVPMCLSSGYFLYPLIHRWSWRMASFFIIHIVFYFLVLMLLLEGLFLLYCSYKFLTHLVCPCFLMRCHSCLWDIKLHVHTLLYSCSCEVYSMDTVFVCYRTVCLYITIPIFIVCIISLSVSRDDSSIEANIWNGGVCVIFFFIIISGLAFPNGKWKQLLILYIITCMCSKNV